MKQALYSVIKRELKRIFTDKRMLVTLFLVPALSIGLIYTAIGYFASNFINDVETHMPSYVISDAPESIIKYIESETDFNQNASITYVEGQSVEAYASGIRDGSLDMFVRFSDDFDQNIHAQTAAKVYTYYNYGEDYSTEANQDFVNQVLKPFKQSVLDERFTNAYTIDVFDIEDMSETAETVNVEKASGKILSSIIPMLLSIFLFAGAMSVVMDSIAGEKERGTLATMLVTPAKREAIAIGKMIAHAIIATLSALSSIVGIIITFFILMLILPDGIDAGVQIGYGFTDILYLIGFAIMLVGIYVGVISLLSALSKNVKEAGTYITPVYMVIMVVSFMNMYAFNTEPLWKYAVPVYGQITGIKEILMYQITPLKFGVALLSALVVWTILVLIIRNLFNNEKVIFTS